jgi:hypothetical protein
MRNHLRNRKLLIFALAVSMLFVVVCNVKLGDAPIGPSVTNNHDNPYDVRLTVTSSRSQIKANTTDSVTITAILVDAISRPIPGETILFGSFNSSGNSMGRIGAYAIVNASGVATVTLHSMPVNDSCFVVAYSPNYDVMDTVIVVFSGVKIAITTNAPAQRVNQYLTITGSMTDASDDPIGSGDTISFTTSTGVFANNTTLYQTRLDLDGQAAVNVTARSARTVTVYCSVGNLRDSIRITFDSSSVPVIGTRQFHIYASKNQLKANHSDTASITAVLTDQNSNPVIGDTILFSCSPSGIGIIDSFAIIGRNGSGSVTLRSTPVNGVCTIRATAVKSRDTASTTVSFSGVTVRLESDVTDLRINEYATITALLTDASGNPIGGDTIVYSTRGGVFTGGDTTVRSNLDPTGKSTTRVTSHASGRIWIYASALNTYDSISLIYTNDQISLAASKSSLIVGGGDSTLLTATLVNGSGQPMRDSIVVFATNAGTITKAIDTTDATGKAYAWLKSAAFSTTATIVASASSGTAVTKVAYNAATVKSVKITLSPDNIGINGGIATLTATVRDVNDNMVSGADINFRILRGPGGGEYIDKPVVTCQNGIAHAQLIAGSVASMYRAVLVAASIGTIADTTKLTISGEPYAISVSRPQDDTITVPNAGQMDPTTFNFNVGAVVVDINGNPVADGTRVNFSMVVSGMAVHRKVFLRWAGLGSGATTDIKPVYGYPIWDIPFEDINNNYHRDENDLSLPYHVEPGYVLQSSANACRGDDVNGDGRNDFDFTVHDLWYDFNGDGKVDTGTVSTPIVDSVPITVEVIDTVCKDTIIKAIVRVTPDTLWMDSGIVVCHEVVRNDITGWRLDTIGYSTDYASTEPYLSISGAFIWADLYPDGHWNTNELVRDVNKNGRYDIPASGDRQWWEYEDLPYWVGQPFMFDRNEFGVAVTTSTNTVGGVANAKLTYPRQLARRLFVTVNAEANGVRDRYGQRFVLPVIVGN